MAVTNVTSFRARDMTAAWRHIDYLLILGVVALCMFGLALVHSATRFFPEGSFLARQGLFLMIGAALAIMFAAVDFTWWTKYSRYFYAAGLAMLVAVLQLGSVVNGTKGWFDFGFFQLQPAEPMKLAAILMAARFLGKEERERGAATLGGGLVIFGLPMGLIMLQPDLGSVLVYLLIGAGMFFAAGIRGRYLLALIVLATGGTALILQSDALEDYQRDRLTTFTRDNCPATDEACYNVKQAQIAISSGGLTGYGYGKGPQTKGQFVPAQQTDFIFTVAGEELGFAGSAVILAMFGLVAWRVWWTALAAPNREGQLICVGVLCMMMFHVFESVGMSMGIMPVTGIPLPFISSGGSALLTMFGAIGLVQNVHMRQWGG